MRATDRLRRVALAGHQGDAGVAREALSDQAPSVRAAGLGALARLGELAPAELTAGLEDEHPMVRRRAAELGASEPAVALVPLLDDADHSVVEAAAWALGERSSPEAGSVEALARVTTSHPEPLCREAAVAALGALGDPGGLPAVLAACGDRATVRRRAVLALAPFDGPEVDAALEQAKTDRDWQVRQAAEDLAEPAGDP